MNSSSDQLTVDSDTFLWIDDHRVTKSGVQPLKEYHINYGDFSVWKTASHDNKHLRDAILTYWAGLAVIDDINDHSIQNPVSAYQDFTGNEILSDDEEDIGRKFTQCYSKTDKISGHIRKKHLSQIHASPVDPGSFDAVQISFPKLPKRFYPSSPPPVTFHASSTPSLGSLPPNANQIQVYRTSSPVPAFSQLEQPNRSQVFSESQFLGSKTSTIPTKHSGLYAAFLKVNSANLKKAMGPKMGGQSHSKPWTENLLSRELINANQFASHYASSIYDLTLYTCKSMTENHRSAVNASPEFVVDIVYGIFGSACSEVITGQSLIAMC
jgi:hypothetical protein